jgi:hypothetical protein
MGVLAVRIELERKTRDVCRMLFAFRAVAKAAPQALMLNLGPAMLLH